MRTPFFGNGQSGTVSTAAARYGALEMTTSSMTATESEVYQLIATGGTISNLRVVLSAAPGVGKNYVFTLRVNGSDTALTVTIADAATSGADTSNSVSVSAGDYVTISCTPTGTPTAAIPRYGLVFDGTDATESVLTFGTADTTNNAATEYGPIHAHLTGSGLTATETDNSMRASTGGTLKKLYIKLTAAPGAGTSLTFTLRKNGSDTALTVTIADAATTGSDTSNTVAVAADDELSLKITASGSAAAVGYAGGLVFVPTTQGESMKCLSVSNNEPSTSAVRYQVANGSRGSGFVATETDRSGLAPIAFTAKHVRLRVTTAPGAGKSWSIALRKSAAAAITATISETDTTGSSGSTADFAADDRIDWETTPSGTPTAVGDLWCSFTCYIAPASTQAPRTMQQHRLRRAA